MSGGAYERTSNYVNYTSGSFTNGGNTEEDLYNASNPGESSKYKTVYEASGTSQSSSYNLAAGKKGDGIYETSNQYNSDTGSWFGTYSYFSYTDAPFFNRGGYYGNSKAVVFFFSGLNGNAHSYHSFRVILAF